MHTIRDMAIQWNELYSDMARELKPSSTRELYKLVLSGTVISLAGGLPSPECFPVKELEAASARVLQKYANQALQYANTQGEAIFLDFLAEHMKRIGAPVPASQLHVVSGSEQGLDAIARMFVDPGSAIAVEDPTYSGALMAFRPYRPRFVTIPTDESGLIVEALEDKLKAGEQIRFLYMMSCFQNPMGTTLIPERRRRLLEVAAKYNLVIVEDDPYGELYYEGSRPEPLAKLDIEMHGELTHVIYVNTFSKTIAPGLRIGWIAAPKDLIGKVVLTKQAMDLHTSPFNQYLIYEVCQGDFWERQMAHIRQVNRVRRDAMLDALAEFMPDYTHWTKPTGGMFVWVTLPETMDDMSLLKSAIDQKMIFVPGSSYYANGDVHNAIRLSFTQPTPDDIVEALRRMSNVIKTAGSSNGT